jgi:protein gp37
VLTKRSERLFEISASINWPNNVWMGVSVESQKYIYRIEHLIYTHAPIKFLSLEPLLGPIPNLTLSGINWVIVGGESGPGARPIKENWVVDFQTVGRSPQKKAWTSFTRSELEHASSLELSYQKSPLSN